jgi:hypothetical protein
VTVLSFIGFALALVGLPLAIGIPISVRVYGPPARSVPVFRSVAKIALAVGVIGALLALVGWATGHFPAERRTEAPLGVKRQFRVTTSLSEPR